MPKSGGDRFDQLPKDDPNYDIARRFHLEGWADSHGVVADTLAGQVSFSDWVESCIKTFQLAAATQVAFKDEIPPSQKCQAVDRMAKLFIRRFEASVRSHSKGLGKTNAKAAIDRLSRRVHEIAARSKQQIFQHALAKEASPATGDAAKAERRPRAIEISPSEGAMEAETEETRAAPVENRHVRLLEQIVDGNNIRLETWASDHRFGRSTVFDWKAARSAGTPLKGKVSEEMAAAIEKAIEQDAKVLGPTRTNSDSSEWRCYEILAA